MPFSAASGYTNLSGGAWSPIIYSKKVQLALRKSSVAQAITNSEYMGEIANMGDSVKVVREPEVSVQAYARGTQVTAQFDYLEDQNAASRIIDKAIEKDGERFNLMLATVSPHTVERMHHTDNTYYKMKAALMVIFETDIDGLKAKAKELMEEQMK